jgi:predicted permease
VKFWSRREESLNEEIQDYLDRQIAENIDAGMAPDEARSAARRKLGPVLRVKEDTRAAWGWMWLERLGQDLRYGLRMLAKNPGFTAVAVISLAVGIGANCAMFSFADALLLRPLPVAHPGEVVTVGSILNLGSRDFGANLSASYPDYSDFRDRSKSFDGLVAFKDYTAGLATEPDALPRLKLGMVVTGNFFRVMGVEPELGRGFRPEEDQVPGRDAVVVLSHDLWEQQFAADRSILGRKIRLSGIEFTVVGVTPARFTGMEQFVRPAFFVPVMMYPRLAGNAHTLETRDHRDRTPSFTVKGRLRSGISVAQAQAEMAVIGKDLERAYPDADANQNVAVRTEMQLRTLESPSNSSAIVMLMTLAGAVLLVACSNVAGLLTSRAPVRTREIALRLSIGAGRPRLIRQLITESLLLGLAGSAAGVGVGYAGVKLFSQIELPTDLPIALTFQMDQRALFFALGVALLSVLLFGLIPAIQATRIDLNSAMKASDAAPPGRKRGFIGSMWGRNLLVAGQVAVSLVLLTVTAWVYQGVHHDLASGPWFRTDHLLLMRFDPSLVHYSEEQTDQFYKQLLERSRSVTGVKSAALASSVPLMTAGGGLDFGAIVPEGYQFPKGQDSAGLFQSRVDENFFDAMGVPIVRGRSFLATDTASAPRVAVVNELAAQHYWPGQDPIGKRFRLDGHNGPWVEIVGVARNSKYLSIGEPPAEFFYLPYRQHPRPEMTLLVQSIGDPGGLVAPVREVVRGLDSNQPVYDVHTMREVYEMRAVRTLNVVIEAVGSMGLMGMIMALAGLYGLMSYAVSRRTREIGIRMAIGAASGSVLRMVLRQGLVLTLWGLSAGLALSYACYRLLQGTIPTTNRLDFLLSWLMAPVLLGVIMLAAYIPARRASRVDPKIALRYE